MKSQGQCRIAGLVLAAGLMMPQAGWADDLDRAEPYRAEVNGAIDVLATAKAAPSASCTSALEEMHTTDSQLKELTDQLGDAGEASAGMDSQKGDVAVGRDVLATDIRTAADDCRPDVVRVCAAVTAADVAVVCEKFSRDLQAADRPGTRP